MCPASGGFTVWMPWAEEGLREKWSESMVNPDPLPPGSGAPYRPVPTLGEIWGGCAGRHRWGHMSLKSTGWSARWSAGSRSGPHLENSRWPSPPTNKAAVQSNPGGQSTNNAQRFVYMCTHTSMFFSSTTAVIVWWTVFVVAQYSLSIQWSDCRQCVDSFRTMYCQPVKFSPVSCWRTPPGELRLPEGGHSLPPVHRHGYREVEVLLLRPLPNRCAAETST